MLEAVGDMRGEAEERSAGGIGSFFNIASIHDHVNGYFPMICGAPDSPLIPVAKHWP